MTASVEIAANPSELNGPASSEDLVSILKTTFGRNEPIQSSVASVLEQLNEFSSKHKFIVNVTKLDASVADTANFSVDNFLGSSWNDKLDGAFHHQIQQDLDEANTKSILLVSVYWIAL
ncbi:unnamed protein product [Kluyveromyces dobzhanskii CBS 2104]|uniref:Topoisomerase I damage affected protein 2 n=1 Tax=Kluyveromyces dobzhanskii CBS 2104 TaxID=1427455 RepID=A0A0A8L2F5_9SACH|nr:unnamed protein product [Kluyveromyces dobzhanskii CBS 2104]